jgi:hypothetical protein
LTQVRITYRPTGEVLAEGPLGWGITPFEGNYYVYKFLFVWMDLHHGEGGRVRNLGWLYWLPNPLLPFIWFRVALPGQHPELDVARY